MTRRQRALLIAEEAMVRLHGEPMFWCDGDLADRRDLIRRVDDELALIETTTRTGAAPAAPAPERRAA
ncbi:hypothetical protein ACIRYZ_38835 [Kitasatospora sp. NPDC101155]|uniref:hypothetical protein n=1 Tax=Kitasatospora sp. NPDC101155 TaxID=3364097 RepID=UPI00382AE441